MSLLLSFLIGIVIACIFHIVVKTFKEWKQGIKGSIIMDTDDSRYLMQGLDW
jgi:hypothetical protein